MKKITVVIVTYNNIKMLEDLLSDLNSQTRKPDEVIIIDNASQDATQAVIKDKYPQVCYLRLSENTGSAGGYTLGLKEAAYRKCDHVFALDDDVRLDVKTIEELEKGFERIKQTQKVGAVRSIGEKALPVDDTKFELMTWRGMFFDSDAIKQVGFPRAEFFIYGEDMEYSLRFAKNGYSFFWINSSRCFNSRTVGQKTVYLFGRKLKFYTDPFRLYYAFRNEISIFLEYGQYVKAWKVLLYSFLVIMGIIHCDRQEMFPKIGAIVLGQWHGLTKKLGKCKRYTHD